MINFLQIEIDSYATEIRLIMKEIAVIKHTLSRQYIKGLKNREWTRRLIRRHDQNQGHFIHHVRFCLVLFATKEKPENRYLPIVDHDIEIEMVI